MTTLTEAKTFTCEGYKLVLYPDGLVKLYQATPRMVTETVYSSEGVSTHHALPTDPTPAGELATVLDRYPLMAATRDGDDPDTWWVDLDCGFQRWHGSKTHRQVRAVLRKCGFAPATTRAVAAYCRAHPQSSCPWQW